MRTQLLRASVVLSSLMACIAVIVASSISTSAKTKLQSSSIDGVVVDQASAAVAGAEVVITSSSITRKTLTDASGHFHFDSLPKEIVTLSITASGFARVAQKINPPEEATPLRFILTP